MLRKEQERQQTEKPVSSDTYESKLSLKKVEFDKSVMKKY